MLKEQIGVSTYLYTFPLCCRKQYEKQKDIMCRKGYEISERFVDNHLAFEARLLKRVYL